jgi:hypothetical protein
MIKKIEEAGPPSFDLGTCGSLHQQLHPFIEGLVAVPKTAAMS